jgi:hypothetical protein
MKFTKHSALVKYVWVPVILAGTYTLDDVPALGNLKEVVTAVVTELS